MLVIKEQLNIFVLVCQIQYNKTLLVIKEQLQEAMELQSVKYNKTLLVIKEQPRDHNGSYIHQYNKTLLVIKEQQYFTHKPQSKKNELKKIIIKYEWLSDFLDWSISEDKNKSERFVYTL